jgi:hypothetical protein
VTPVLEQLEYDVFDHEVRRPGLEFLALTPRPNNREFRKAEFWTRSISQLRLAYCNMCAYTSTYMPNGGSLDHFTPKAHYPQFAYEWANFRLCDPRVNNWKGSKFGVMDPFAIKEGWFVLGFPECVIRPDRTLSTVHIQRIRETIHILKLNDDDQLVQHRYNLAFQYLTGEVSFDFLRWFCPFVALEIERQGGLAPVKAMFGLR